MFNPFDDAAKAIERAAQAAAKEVERAAQAAAKEAERAAQAAAKEAERLAQIALQETNRFFTDLDREIQKMTWNISQETTNIEQSIKSEISRFGGDIERAASTGQLQTFFSQFANQFFQDNEAQMRRVGQAVLQIQHSSHQSRSLKKVVDNLKNRRPTTEAEVKHLLEQTGIERLIQDLS